jgi:hypothetical protein
LRPQAVAMNEDDRAPGISWSWFIACAVILGLLVVL